MILKMGKNNWQLKQRQRGFTLVNIAALVVSSGVAVGVAVQGGEILSSAKYDSFYKELTQIENVVWDYKLANKRWPGDCNQDGLIGYQPLNSVEAAATEGHAVSDVSNAEVEACKPYSEGVESVNASFSDLRVSGLLNSNSNLSIAKHSMGDFFQIGQAQSTDGKSAANVIVAYGVPADVARYVDESWDGDAAGDKGRIRRWDVQAAGGKWPAGQQKVALAYYFDKKLP